MPLYSTVTPFSLRENNNALANDTVTSTLIGGDFSLVLQAAHHRDNTILGGLDILVCNAASNPYFGPQEGISDEQFRKILDNNIIANHWMISMAVPEMKERRRGSIIIVSSIGGLRGSPVIGAYCISKAADMQLARNLAVEYGPHNIRVNCINPVFNPDTGLSAEFAGGPVDEARRQKFLSTIPLGRFSTAADVANAALYLASDEAAFISGVCIEVDGARCV